MPKEIEVGLYLYDDLLKNHNIPNKENIIQKIKKLGAKKKDVYLFKVMVFQSPKNGNEYLRIRDEGHRITMTLKNRSKKSKFENEEEIIIDNFENGIKILEGIGCKKKHYYEKIRELWTYKNSEIVFDYYIGLPVYMEVESPTVTELNDVLKKINLKIPNKFIPEKKLFKKLFLCTKKNYETFNSTKYLLNKCLKNKKDLKRILDIQLNLYNKIKK
jgi:predicted adenylyl cyclase CyaB